MATRFSGFQTCNNSLSPPYLGCCSVAMSLFTGIDRSTNSMLVPFYLPPLPFHLFIRFPFGPFSPLGRPCLEHFLFFFLLVLFSIIFFLLSLWRRDADATNCRRFGSALILPWLPPAYDGGVNWPPFVNWIDMLTRNFGLEAADIMRMWFVEWNCCQFVG